ncbi:MAG: hypothetical protein U5P10_05155 [Spirochaetia bacterium]|nr:hypothetical protein [Spirochaetia bacterium]
MKRLGFISITAVCLLLGAAVSVTAFDWDWGGELANTTGYLFADEGEVTQEDRLSLWLDGEMKRGVSTLGFRGQASYLFTEDRAYLLDIDELRFRGSFPAALGSSSMLQASLGRFGFSDPTGYILMHTADGAGLNLLFPRVHFKIDAAYTGLLLNPTSDIRLSAIDLSEQSDEENNTFGPKRFFTQGQVSFIDVGKRLQNWVLFGLAQFDLRDPESGEETIDSQYWGTLLSYKLGRYLYHDGFLVVGTSQISSVEDTKKLSLLTGFTSRYLRKDWLDSKIAFYGLVATPDAPVEDIDIGFDMPFGLSKFRPVNKPTLGLVVDPTLDSLMYTGLSYSLRPFLDGTSPVMRRLRPSVGGRAYFRIYEWNADWMDLAGETDSWFVGTEYDAGFTWDILSDLSAGLTGAVFVPGSAWVKDAGSDYMLRFELSARF